MPPHRGHPTCDDFAVIDQPGVGSAVVTRRGFRSGEWIARFDGVTVGYTTQHSLQKSARVHIVDMNFAGILTHGCAPNAVLDMDRQHLHALRDIAPGQILTIDYEATEDELFAPFVCRCGAADCRRAIRGRNFRRRD